MNKCRSRRAKFMIADLLSVPTSPEVDGSENATGSDTVVSDVIDSLVQSPAAEVRGKIHQGVEATNHRFGVDEAKVPSARDALVYAAEAYPLNRSSIFEPISELNCVSHL